MIQKIQRFLLLVAQRQDLIVVGFILLVIALMILPLPTWLMDLMIAINITIGLLFILLAVYLKSPLEFSTLPAAMLIATLIRIAITIATSRLILVQADAGEIIKSFGTFVIAGNLVVGLVIFAIIAIAQFVVITRGAERVAEVTARFVLDALPGKQMSIDSDLRAGDIDRHEARRRRHALEHESMYYGAMDGAMKFVKGDAIVSMIIIFVNLAGGVMVGTMLNGMDVSTAFATYALLTVGDGLSSQIPAILVAVAGGIVVTRVTTDVSSNLGADLARELVSSAQSLGIAAAALLALGLVPGFPTVTFFGLGLACAAGAIAIVTFERRRDRAAETASLEKEARAAEQKTDNEAVIRPSRAGETFTLRISADLEAAIDRDTLADALSQSLGAARTRLGVMIPAPGLLVDARLRDFTVAFEVEGAEAWRMTLPENCLFVPHRIAAPLIGAHGVTAATLPQLGPGAWLPAHVIATQLPGDAAGHALDISEALGRMAGRSAAQWASRAFGLQEADHWLTTHAGNGYGGLVEQVRQTIALARLADTLRQLLAEDVSLGQPRIVLESLIDLAPRIEDNAQLADHLRLALSRPLSAQHSSVDRHIPACVIELDLEEHLREAITESPTGYKLSLGYESADRLATALQRTCQAAEDDGTRVVALTSFDIRRALHRFAAARGVSIHVMAFEEVANDYRIAPVAALGMSALVTEDDIAERDLV